MKKFVEQERFNDSAINADIENITRGKNLSSSLNIEKNESVKADTDKSLTENDVRELSLKYSNNQKEIDDFTDFIANKFKKPITRRDFITTSASIAVGLTIGYAYFKENIDNLWVEFQKEKVSETKKEYRDLQSSTQLLEQVTQYPEIIKKSEKQNLDKFAKDLPKKDFDNLIVGEWHGFGPTSEKAAYLLEELMKNNKKISVICFEKLSYTDSEDTEAIKKFNNGELSVLEISKIIPGKEPLFELAKKYSIEIAGIEKDKFGLDRLDWYSRFKDISERIGEISKKKSKDGIVVTYIGQNHATVDSWQYENSIKKLAGWKDTLPSEEEALKNNYTIKEYLEEIDQNPIVVQIEDWKKLTNNADSAFTSGIDQLSLKDKKIFYKEVKKQWKDKYVLKETGDFVVSYPYAEKNTFSMIIPSEIPDNPPKLTEKIKND